MTKDQAEGIAEITIVFFVGLTLIIPMIALSLRFALKPVIETWMRMKSSQVGEETIQMQDRRIALLEAEVQSLQQVVQHRVEATEFDRALGTH